MEFRVLGKLEVEDGGVDVTPIRPKQVIVLGLLLVRAGEIVRSDELVDVLWGERAPATAQTALYGHISALRKRLGAERIETCPRGYLLRLGPEDEIDVRRFERAITEADVNGPLERARKLREALALFRGEPLADFPDEWFAQGEAHRLAELRLAAIEERVEADLQLGRHSEALPELERLIVEHPHRERLRAQLMVALYRAGRQAEAVAAFGDARRVLVDELGMEPSRALRRLEHQILNQDAELAAPDVFAPAMRSAGPNLAAITTFLLARGDCDHGVVSTVVGEHAGSNVEAREGLLLASFARARDAAGAAIGIERATRGAVSIGIDSAEATGDGDRPGAAGAHAASICSVAHGGQILLSKETRDLLGEARLDDAAIGDVGEHRLSDLGPARRLYQLHAPDLMSDFPPPVGLDARPTNLSLQARPLVGREREIREVAELLTRAGGRLLTLTGPGGTGKTRLATHVAAELLDEFTDGVYFVGLAALADSRLVLPTVARTLGVVEIPGEAVLAQLVRHLRARRFLLLLDNAEHVLAAAAEIEELAHASDGSRVLATSRMPLHVRAEATYAVSPLTTEAGVALFSSCARTVRPGFALNAGKARVVADICTALDGLPLAIELAAARVAVLPPAALLQRLDRRLELLKRRSPDVPARHRGLRAAIDWSYELLGPDERKLLARLAAFVGGCSLATAEAVCGDDLDVVDHLSSLVDTSLVLLQGTDDVPRFTMLETIRAYAAELLDESDEGDQLKRRHAEHFLSLAEEAEPHLRENPGEWLERLEDDHDNLRAALDRVSRSADTEGGMRLAGALWRFWYLRGHLAEGRRRLEDALARDERPTAARAKALIGATVMAVNCGDSAAAIQRAEEGIEVCSELRDTWGAAYAGFMLGTALTRDDPARAEHLLDVSAQTFRELGDLHSMLLVLRNLAAVVEQHDPTRAKALREDGLQVARDSANPRIEASTLGALAIVAVGEGRLDDALAMLDESLRLHRGLGDVLDTTVDLCRSAAALGRAGEPAAAVQILASFDEVRPDIGIRGTDLVEMNEETLSAAHTQLGAAAFAEAQEEGRRLTSGQAISYALSELSRARVKTLPRARTIGRR